MTMDRSLKSAGGLAGTRSVLTRAERIARMKDEGKFDPATNSPLGLPKTKVRHSKAGSKAKKAAEEAVPAAGEAGAVKPDAPAAPAAKGAKGAAPAKGKK